ncbi:hypothetical protein DL93DRAFT_2103646, partial [Clavulina sp. PMI_390]
MVFSMTEKQFVDMVNGCSLRHGFAILQGLMVRSYYSDDGDGICGTDGTECSAAPPKSFSDFAAGLASRYWRLGIRSRPKSPSILSSKPQSPLRQAALFRCIEYNNWKENQSKALDGATNDEAIWAISVTLGLKNLGYTYLLAEELDHAMQFPRRTSTADRYTLSPHNYTMENANNKNPYLGYGVEPARAGCVLVRAARKKEAQAKAKAVKGVKVAKEVEKGTGDANVKPVVGKEETEAELVPYAYLMAKHAHQFAPGGLRGWDPATFEQVAKEAGITFVAGVVDADDHVIISPNVVENRGAMERRVFVGKVAEASVAIGMGQPFASVTPYEALCFGVPFINPIWNMDMLFLRLPSELAPSMIPDHCFTSFAMTLWATHNRAKWEVQHGLLKFLDPPYVYNVFKDNTAGLVKAIKAAVANPIDHHVPEPMLMRSVEMRLDKMLLTNWYIEALELLVERFEEGKGP